MRVIDPAVPRAAIDQEIRAATYPGHAPGRWALPLLAALDREASTWMRVDLEEVEFAELWLPEHAGEPCHGDTMRLGEAIGGLCLRDAGVWLARHDEAYAAANRSCWGRILHAATAPTSPIVVSPRPVGDRTMPAHASLVVVDGLHRAVGYWRAGRRTCEAYVPVLAPR